VNISLVGHIIFISMVNITQEYWMTQTGPHMIHRFLNEKLFHE